MNPAIHNAIARILEDDRVALHGADVAKTTYPPFGREHRWSALARRIKPTPGS